MISIIIKVTGIDDDDADIKERAVAARPYSISPPASCYSLGSRRRFGRSAGGGWWTIDNELMVSRPRAL